MTPAQPLNFLFATMDGGGNVAPTLAVVAALAARGSRVRVMSDAVNRQDAEDAGADFTAWTRGPSRTVRSRETDAPDWMVPTALEGLQLVSEHFMGGAAAPYAEDLTEALDEEPAYRPRRLPAASVRTLIPARAIHADTSAWTLRSFSSLTAITCPSLANATEHTVVAVSIWMMIILVNG